MKYPIDLHVLFGLAKSDVLELKKSETTDHRASNETEDNLLNADIQQIIRKVLSNDPSISKSPSDSFAGNSLDTDETYIGLSKDMPKHKSKTSGRVKK